MLYTTTANRCPECGCTFHTLEDEYGQHECPNCGYFPYESVKCAGCDEEIRADEDGVHVLEDGAIIHDDWECLVRHVSPKTMPLKEAIKL